MIDYNKYKYLVYTPAYDAPKTVVTLDTKPDTGFVSTYIYDEGIKEYIEEEGGLKGFSRTKPKVVSPILFLDFDDAEEEARAFYTKLKKNGVGFKVFNSGGRSIHFHIRRKHVEPSATLFRNDKTWVAHNVPGADTCLYECTRIFRLPGTIHHKTGKAKILLEEVAGRPIDIPNTYVEPTVVNRPTVKKEGLFSDPYVRSYQHGFNEGSRNREAYQLIKLMQDYGCTGSFIVEFIGYCNEVSLSPMEDDELQGLFRKHL